MSYILEALRRAETERDRGQVPGLNAQSAPTSPPPSAARPSAARWLGLGLAGVVVLAALLAWWLWRRGEPPLPVVAGAAAVPATTIPSPPMPEPTPVPAAVPVLAPVPAPAPLPVVVSAPPPPAAAAKPASAAVGVRTVAVAALTAEQRRDWPPLAMGGAVYSDSPASRFVIIGGQLLREGEAAAPGVTVDRIGPRSVMLRWRDLRVEVPF